MNIFRILVVFYLNHNVLNYYIECNILDNDPSQKDYAMIPGIDLALLRKNRKVSGGRAKFK